MIVGIPAVSKRQGKLQTGRVWRLDLLRVFDDNSMLFIHSNEIAPNSGGENDCHKGEGITELVTSLGLVT